MATNQHNKKTTCGQTHTHTPAHTQMHMQARTQISNAQLKPDEDTELCPKPWWKYGINERMNWPWLGLRAMLPEFKASSKRLNIVCNLEAEKKKGHINTTATHNTKLLSLTTSWQSKCTRPGGFTRGDHFVETATRLWSPLNQQQHVDSWFCLSACLMAGGCV